MPSILKFQACIEPFYLFRDPLNFRCTACGLFFDCTNEDSLLYLILSTFTRLAVCDGYRAVVLRPKWARAYFRLSNAFKNCSNLEHAVLQNDFGISLAPNDSTELEELNRQKKELSNIIIFIIIASKAY